MKYISDQEIIAAIRKGQDREVIDSLYATVLPKVKKHVCNNSGSLDDAFDVFQDALMIFYKLVIHERFDNAKYNVHGFLFTVCKNVWINTVKKRISSQNREKKVDFDDIDPGILQNLIEVERKDILDKLFKDLGDKCKEILILFYYQKLSFKEISEKMGDMSEDAVKVKSHRCKKQLADKIKGDKHLIEQLRH